MSTVKSGKKLVDSFFDDLKQDVNLDKNIVEIITDLYITGKLTSTAIGNALERMRTQDLDDENKKN